jgi:hypothetical protein
VHSIGYDLSSTFMSVCKCVITFYAARFEIATVVREKWPLPHSVPHFDHIGRLPGIWNSSVIIVTRLLAGLPRLDSSQWQPFLCRLQRLDLL